MCRWFIVEQEAIEFKFLHWDEIPMQVSKEPYFEI